MISISSQQLRKAADLQDKIDGLQRELESILGNGSRAPAKAKPAKAEKPKKRTMSEEGRQRIIEAQRRRWAAIKKNAKK